MKSKLKDTSEANEKLQLAVEDLVSRSKRQNLHVVGIPEGVEGDDARLYMTTLFEKVVWGDHGQLEDLELDRAHCSLGPKPAQGSRPFIVRFHRFISRRSVCYCGLRRTETSRTRDFPSGSLKISAPPSPRSHPRLLQQGEVFALQRGNTLRTTLPSPLADHHERPVSHI